MRQPKYWTEERKALLREHYFDPVKRKHVLDLFPGRGISAIQKEAAKLGVVARWSPEEDATLRKHWDGSITRELRRLLPRRSAAAIWIRAVRAAPCGLGLETPRNEVIRQGRESVAVLAAEESLSVSLLLRVLEWARVPLHATSGNMTYRTRWRGCKLIGFKPCLGVAPRCSETCARGSVQQQADSCAFVSALCCAGGWVKCTARRSAPREAPLKPNERHVRYADVSDARKALRKWFRLETPYQAADRLNVGHSTIRRALKVSAFYREAIERGERAGTRIRALSFKPYTNFSLFVRVWGYVGSASSHALCRLHPAIYTLALKQYRHAKETLRCKNESSPAPQGSSSPSSPTERASAPWSGGASEEPSSTQP